MLALGIILILLAAGMVYVVFAGATEQTAVFDLGAFNLEMNTLGVFVAGGATVLVLVLGLALLRAGLRSANRRRKEKKELKRLHARDERSARPATDSHPTGGAGVATGTTSTSSTPETTSGATTTGGTTSGGPTAGGPQDTRTDRADTPHDAGDHAHRDGPVTDR